MDSRERVRKAIQHIKTDRVPANMECVPSVWNRIMKEKNLSSREAVRDFYQIDIAEIFPSYVGKRTKSRDFNGKHLVESIYGGEMWYKNNNGEIHGVMQNYPFDEDTTVEDILAFDWITPDDFDYESIKRQCEENKGRAIQFGHEGPFQLSTFMMEMSVLFEKMIVEPEVAKALFDRFVQFELEHYERIFIACDGQADILRPHDDYGTQISLLFSTDMFKEFFAENTKKLTALAHKYGAFYQQHSCGAVHDFIPLFIDCGVDVLEPIQKVKGLEPERLVSEFGGKIAFHGGIDTQGVLPLGTPDEVRNETKKYAKILGADGGYILMASQSIESDVTLDNIDALFEMENRYV